MATLGWTDTTSSFSSSSTDKTGVSAAIADETGPVQTASARLSMSGGSTTARFVIYASNGAGGDPGTLLAQSNELTVSGTSQQLYTFSFTSGNQIQITEGATYWIGVAWRDPGDDSINFYRLSGGSRYESGQYAPDPFVAPSSLSGPLALYVTYQGAPTQATKTGADTAGGVESGTVTTTASGSETARGTDSGGLVFSGSDPAATDETGYVSEGKRGDDTSTSTEVGASSAVLDPPADTSTGGETGGTTAALDPPFDVSSGGEAGHIAIPGQDTTAAVDEHDDPTLVTSTSGEQLGAAEGGYVETLYGDLIVNLYAVDPDDGGLVPLPDYVSLEVSRERNSAGAIALDYPAGGKNFELLRQAVTTSRDLEFELWTNGTSTWSLRGYLQEAAGDDVAEESVWRFTGAFLEMRADEAVVYPQDRGEQIIDPDTGEPTWSNARRELLVHADTPGELVALLLGQAHDRGVLTDVSRDFTTTHDSRGVPWPNLLSAKFSPGLTYTQILNQLVDLHLVEWAILWTGTEKVLKLWAAEGRGADLTSGPRPVILRRGRNLLDAPRKWSIRDAATTVLAAGSEGVYDDATDATALARRGRRVERYTSLGSASDESAVAAFAQAELASLTPGLQVIEHGIGMLPGEARPIIAFDVGDWVYSHSGIETERLRVVQWTLRLDDDRRLSGTVTLNDTVQDALERMRERLNAITSGEVIAGTSEPGAPGIDRTPPAAPEGVVASSIAYQDPQHGPGTTDAMVTVGWLPVTTNADGADSPLVQAAVYILDKLQDEQAHPPDPDDYDYAPIRGDWTWENCPRIVTDFATPLRERYADDGSPSDQQAWLSEFIAEGTQIPTAADDIAGYRVRYTYLGLDPVGGDPSELADHSYIEATPPGGTSRPQYSFGRVGGGSLLRIEVCAFDRAGNRGAWTTIEHRTADDAAPPPVPAAPDVTSYLGILAIEWDGRGAEGEPMPADFSHVDVHVSPARDFIPDESTYVDRLHAAGVMPWPNGTYDVTYFAALRAVDHAGNISAASAQDSATLQRVADTDVEQVSVGKLSAGIMTALMTVSGLIRTGQTGARVEIDADGLRCYNDSGDTVFSYDISDAELDMFGRLTAGAGVGQGRTIEVNPNSDDPEINFYPNSSRRRVRWRSVTSPPPGGGADEAGFWMETLDPSGDWDGPILAASQNAIWLSYRREDGAFDGAGLRLYSTGTGAVTIDEFGVHGTIPLGHSGNGLSLTAGGDGHPGGYRAYIVNGVLKFVQNSTNNYIELGGGSAGSYKSFVIPHPTDGDRWLVHGCTESPWAGVEYWGEAEIVDGQAVVPLPEYFEALTEQHNRNVQVTPVDQLCMVAADPIVDGRVTLRCSGPDGTRVNWLVKAVRRHTEFDPEPRHDAVTVRGTGPYRYIEDRKGARGD